MNKIINIFITVLILLIFTTSNIVATTIFSTDTVRSISISPLDNTTIIVAWGDSTNEDRTFSIYDTNGTIKVGPIDVDDVAGASYYTCIGAAAFNSTHFVIGYEDHAVNDIYFSIYNTSGGLLVGPTQVDDNVGVAGDNSYSASVSALNSTHFVIGWFDANDEDATVAIYNSSGGLVTGPTDVDSAVSNAAHSVSVSALNSTHFIVGWFDGVDTDATFSIYNTSGNLITGPIDVDVDVGNSNSVVVSAFNDTHFVIGWFDDVDEDATFSIYNTSGGLLTGPIDADDVIGGTGYSVAVSALNSTHFVISWFDEIDGDVSFRLYSSSGVAYTGIIDANTTSDKYQDVSSYEAATGIGIYDDNFIIGHNYNNTIAQWMSYDGDDGSAWDGTVAVGVVSYIPPDPTTLTHTTGNYWINYSWAVGSGNVTDSYNVSHNSVWTNNTTITYIKNEVGCDNWSNITVWAFNSSGTGTLSNNSITDQVQAIIEKFTNPTFVAAAGAVVLAIGVFLKAAGSWSNRRRKRF